MRKKQVFCLSVAIFAFFSFIAMIPRSAQAADDSFQSGDVVTAESGALYYLGFDKNLHPFPNSAVFHSWHSDFLNVKRVTNKRLSAFRIGHPVCIRPGTWLVTFPSTDVVYAVEPGCRLRPMRSTTELFILYGLSWESRLIHLDDIHVGFYTINEIKSSSGTDGDGDGIDAERERQYGTSDSDNDSDNDGVSDYEEIFYWSSDPLRIDTDGDGVSDATEIVNGQSPTQAVALGTLGTNVYDLPSGSVALEGKTGYYYQSTNGSLYSMAPNVFDPGDRYNGYDRYFLLQPPHSLSFFERRKGNMGVQNALYLPTVYQGSKLITL
ncbi:MAG: hypothetical protein ABII02_02325 [Candidatus Magasanikbacteria bacterium]